MRGDDDLCVLGMRFTADKLVPAERFQRLREELGDTFVGVEIDSSTGQPVRPPGKARTRW